MDQEDTPQSGQIKVESLPKNILSSKGTLMELEDMLRSGPIKVESVSLPGQY